MKEEPFAAASTSEKVYRLAAIFERKYKAFATKLLKEAAGTEDLELGTDERFCKTYNGVPFYVMYNGSEISVHIRTTLDYADRKTNIIDQVYLCILRELKKNVASRDNVTFYPAIGGDDRVGKVWTPEIIIGIDPSMKTERFSHVDNVHIINKNAEDIDHVREELDRQRLPRKGDIMIAKGTDIIYMWPPLNQEMTEEEYRESMRKQIRNLTDSYLCRNGIILAMNPRDADFYKNAGYQEIQVISEEFRKALDYWNEVLDELPGPATGMWLATDVKGFINR